MHQQFAWNLFLFDVILERIRLLENPCFTGIVRAGRNEDASRFDVELQLSKLRIPTPIRPFWTIVC